MSDSSTQSKPNVHKEGYNGEKDINPQISSGNIPDNAVPDMQNKRRSASSGDHVNESEIERICPKVNCPEKIVSMVSISGVDWDIMRHV